MNKEPAYKTILERTEKNHVRNIGRYLDKLKYKWLKEINDLQIFYYGIVKDYHG